VDDAPGAIAEFREVIRLHPDIKNNGFTGG